MAEGQWATVLTKQVMSDDPSAHPAAHIAWYDCLHKDACREHSREDQATHVLSRSVKSTTSGREHGVRDTMGANEDNRLYRRLPRCGDARKFAMSTFLNASRQDC